LAIYNKKTFNEDYILLMLTGTKAMGFKFSSRRVAPYRQMQAGDIIYLKESSGPIRGRVHVHSVHNEELTDSRQIMEFLVTNASTIGISSDTQLNRIWKKNASSYYLCWWKMVSPEICDPIYIQKNDRRAWVADYTVPEYVLASF
jgi:hypothetical protein